MKRRTFLAGILAAGVAPAIVHAGALMRVNPKILTRPRILTVDHFTMYQTTVEVGSAAFDREQWVPVDPPVAIVPGMGDIRTAIEATIRRRLEEMGRNVQRNEDLVARHLDRQHYRADAYSGFKLVLDGVSLKDISPA